MVHALARERRARLCVLRCVVARKTELLLRPRGVAASLAGAPGSTPGLAGVCHVNLGGSVSVSVSVPVLSATRRPGSGARGRSARAYARASGRGAWRGVGLGTWVGLVGLCFVGSRACGGGRVVRGVRSVSSWGFAGFFSRTWAAGGGRRTA